MKMSEEMSVTKVVLINKPFFEYCWKLQAEMVKTPFNCLMYRQPQLKLTTPPQSVLPSTVCQTLQKLKQNTMSTTKCRTKLYPCSILPGCHVFTILPNNNQ